MAYRKDPRENVIDLDKHAVWEQDNRVEARYVWNAAVLDLCDMSPEEYMKNPIIEAIINSTDSASTEELKQAIKDLGDKVVENDDENTDTIVSAITDAAEAIVDVISGTVYNQVAYYFASINNLVPVEELSTSDFVMDATIINSDSYFHYVLGDPTEENWEKYLNKEIDEQQLRELSANDFYMMLPNAYGTTRKFIIVEEGTNDVTNNFEIIPSSLIDGFTLLRFRDVDHFNIDFPDEQNVHVSYKIKIVN